MYIVPLLLSFIGDGQVTSFISLLKTSQSSDESKTIILLFFGGLSLLDFIGVVSAMIFTIKFSRVNNEANFSVLEKKDSFFYYPFSLLGMVIFYSLDTVTSFVHVEITLSSFNIGMWIFLMALALRVRLSLLYSVDQFEYIRDLRASIKP